MAVFKRSILTTMFLASVGCHLFRSPPPPAGPPQGAPVAGDNTPIVTAAQLEGFWIFSGVVYKGAPYDRAFNIPDVGAVPSDDIILHFWQGKLIQYFKTYAPIERYLEFQVRGNSIVTSEFRIAIKSFQPPGSLNVVPKFVLGIDSEAERFTKIPGGEAAALLRENPIYRRFFQ